MTGQQVFLKLENLQMTGSFKERGALNRIATPDAATGRSVESSPPAPATTRRASRITPPSAASAPSSSCRITTPLVKVTATRGFGGEVVLHGANYDEACVEATRLCEAQGMTFIHPFDDPLVMAGQGTIGLELLEQIEDLEAVVVPIGGGGLIGGIACAIKESQPRHPRHRRSDVAPAFDAARPCAAHHPVTLDPATTIADGIAVRRAGTVTFPVVAKVRRRDRHGRRRRNRVRHPHPSGARKDPRRRCRCNRPRRPSAAAELSCPPGTRTAVLVCGGNIDVTLLSRIIERGLVQDGRLIRLRIHLLDRPGALTDLTRLIASHRANIVDTLYNRAYYGVNLGDTAIDITMETRGPRAGRRASRRAHRRRLPAFPGTLACRVNGRMLPLPSRTHLKAQHTASIGPVIKESV